MKLTNVFTMCASAVVAFLAIAPATTPVFADEKPAVESTEKKPRKPAAGRVPNNYGKLGLTAKQKEDIYAIQGKYREQEAALEQQLKELEAQRDKEIHDVLSAEQKAALAKLETEAAEKKKSGKPTAE